MDLFRLHRRIAAWLAIWVLLVGALLPALSQAAVGGAGKADWVEVCSASSMVWVKADGTQTPGGHDTADVSQHCPWCSLHGAGALPSSDAAGVLFVPLSGERPQSHSPSSRPTQVSVPHSRAPPLAS
ncbi:MAG: DUF2946 family protein [Burkholderiaceae bacterium]